MPRFIRDSLRGGEFTSASAGVLNGDLPACEESDVRVLTQSPADHRLHVFGPS